MIMPMMLMARKIVILLIMRIGIGEDDIKDIDGNGNKNNLNDDERKKSATCSTHTLVVKICRLISTPITCVFTLLLWCHYMWLINFFPILQKVLKVFHLTELQSHVNSQTVWAEIGSSQTRIISYRRRWSCYWLETWTWNIDHIICKWFASNTCLQQVWSVGRSLPASCCKAVLHPRYLSGLEHFQYSSLIFGH